MDNTLLVYVVNLRVIYLKYQFLWSHVGVTKIILLVVQMSLHARLRIYHQGLRFFQLDNPNFAGRKGAVLVFDLNQPDKDVEVAKIRGDLEMSLFNPHGITSWTDESGNIVCLKLKYNLQFVLFCSLTDKSVIIV